MWLTRPLQRQQVCRKMGPWARRAWYRVRLLQKKMKRVEWWGMTDVNVGGSNNASAATLHHMDTIPVSVINGMQRHFQSQSQVFPSSASFIAPVLLQEKKCASGSAKDCERDWNRDPPSPPVIATLQTTDDEDPGRRRRDAMSSGG
jgi:hypothetical protein